MHGRPTWCPPAPRSTLQASRRHAFALRGSPGGRGLSGLPAGLAGRVPLGRRRARVPVPELRSWHGLYRIWFDLRGHAAILFPLLHSAFWVEHKLWGDATLGYHLVNILLHATAALMVALILRRLAIPGRLPGGGHLRPASGAGGIGGLDHGAEEHPFGRVLPGRHAGLPALRPDAEGAVVLAGVGRCSCWPC